MGREARRPRRLAGAPACSCAVPAWRAPQNLPTRNGHPTCKPLSLVAWLLTLGCPDGGLCLDPFLGSGTILVGARMLGFEAVGVEREADYVAIAEARLAAVKEPEPELELIGEQG